MLFVDPPPLSPTSIAGFENSPCSSAEIELILHISRISLSRGRENTRSSLVEATTRPVRFETVQPTAFSIFPAVNPPDNNLLQSTPESFQVQSKPESFRPNPRFLIEPEVGNTVDQEEIVDSLLEQRFQFFPAKTAEQKEVDDQLAKNEQLIQDQNQLILFPEDSAIHHAQLTWNQDPFRFKKLKFFWNYFF